MLRVDLEYWDGKTAFAVYGKFVVDDESNKYKLTATNYIKSSSAGNSLGVLSNMFLTNNDRNNLPYINYNPAQEYTGAWWYCFTSMSNLNCQYLGNTMAMNGMTWIDWSGYPLYLKRSEMKIQLSSFI